MSESVMENVKDGLPAVNEAIGKLTSAIEQAATNYGEDAVNLVLAAYQIQAWTSVALFFISTVLLVFLLRFMVGKQYEWAKEQDSDLVGFTYTLSFIATCALLLISLLSFSPLKIAAAFGFPEVLIAAKALESVGLW